MNDEKIRKESQQNYDTIQQAKKAYLAAQQSNDQQGMTTANNQANAIRSVYGFSSADGANFTPNQSQNTYGNAYQKVVGMRNEAKNAYSKLTNQQTNANVYNIDRNRSNVNNQYKGSVNILNQSKQEQMQHLPEQMAKLGLYGSGTGETAIGNITNAYAQQLQNLTAQRDNALYDIDTQISNAKAQGQEQLANYAYQMAMQSPQDYLQMLQSQKEEDKYNEATAYSRGRDIVGDKERADATAYGKERDAIADIQWDKNFEITKEQFDLTKRQVEDAINFNWSQFNENKEQFWAGLKQQLNLSDRDFKEMVRQFNLQYSLNTKKASAKELTSPYSSPPPKKPTETSYQATDAYNIAKKLMNSGSEGSLKAATYIVESNLSPSEKDQIITKLGISLNSLEKLGDY